MCMDGNQGKCGGREIGMEIRVGVLKRKRGEYVEIRVGDTSVFVILFTCMGFQYLMGSIPI